jgi:hypothetical protein
MNYTTRPDQGLAIASGLVQGVERGMNAYYQRTQANQQMQMQQQQMQATAELRRMQMMKLQQEVMPQTIDAAKINALVSGVDNGVPGAEQALGYQWKKSLDGIQTPAQAQVFNQWMQSHVAARQPSPMPGGDPGVPRAPDAVLPPEGQPQMAPQTSQRAVPTFNHAEQKIVGQIYQGRIQQNIAGARNQTQLQVTDLNNQNKKEIQDLIQSGKVDIQDLINGGQQKIQDLRNQGLLSRQGLANQGAEKVATIRADATVKAASMRGSSKVKDPVEASILKQIENNQKTIDSLSKPSNGFSMELPADVKRRTDALNAQNEKLKQTYQAHTGRPYPGSSPSGAQPAAGGQGPKPPAKEISAADAKAAIGAGQKIPAGTVIVTPDGRRGTVQEDGTVK